MFSALLYAKSEHPTLRAVLRTLRPRLKRAKFRQVCRVRRQFLRFCRAYRLVPLPAEPSTMIRYVQALRLHETAKSVTTKLTPVCRMHREAGFASPRGHELVAKLLRAYEKEDAAKREPVQSYTVEQVEEICDTFVGEDIYTRRTHAIITSAFWGELDAEELIDLDLGNLDRFPDHWIFRNVGIRRRRVTLDRCKNPQHCPIKTLERWLRVARLTNGKVFRAASHWSGKPWGSALQRTTIALYWNERRKRLAPHLPRLPLTAFRASHQVAAFHAGVSYATMAERGGYTRHIDLLRRLHRIITPQPGGRQLEPIGRRASGGRRRRQRLMLRNV
jgi:hypothetical protein